MRGPIHRVATVAVLFQHRPSAAFSWGNKTALWDQLNPVGRFGSRMNSGSIDGIVMEESDRFVFYKLDATESTQDEARRLLKENTSSGKCLAVTAKEQTKGRGTSGRQWIGLSGNVFLTIAIPFDRVPVLITLLPLKVGTTVARATSKLLQECRSSSKVTVKWPNDVLVDERKIAGVLIESETTMPRNESWLLVGIGINLMQAPEVPTEGPNRGRPSTSIRDSCEKSHDFADASTLVAVDIATELINWIHDEQQDKHQASDKVVQEWMEWAEFGGQQVIRDTEENEIVVPIGIEPDGQLRVRGQDGRERLLVADYLL